MLAAVGLIAVPWFLASNLVAAFARSAVPSTGSALAVVASRTASTFTPMIPGITLPFADVAFVLIGLAVSLLVHEFGHAVAAIAQGLRVLHVGAHISLLMPFPAFFVSIGSALDALPPRKQLRVFAAGVWHNAVLTALCVGMLHSPALLTCCTAITHTTDLREGALRGAARGAHIQHVGPALVASVRPGDRVVAFNGEEIADSAAWFAALKRWHTASVSGLRGKAPRGLGRQRLVERALRRGFCSSGGGGGGGGAVPPCCADPQHAERLCVHWGEGNRSAMRDSMGCVTAAVLVVPGSAMCASSADCAAGLRCLLPVLHAVAAVDAAADAAAAAKAAAENAAAGPSAVFRLRFERAVESNRSDYTVFIGAPSELHAALSVARDGTPAMYVPRAYLNALPAGWGKWLFRATEGVSKWLIKALQYTAAVSLSIGVLNAAPVFRLDGAFCWGAVLRGGCASIYKRERVARVTHACARVLLCNSRAGVHTVRKSVERNVLIVGSLLLLANVGLAMVSLVW